MSKRTADFDSWHLATLAEPRAASDYLTAVANDSPELILDAIQDVIQARTATEVAKEAGVTRESLYRSFSSAAGNPRHQTLRSVLRALGVRISAFAPIEDVATTTELDEQTQAPRMGTGYRRSRRTRRSRGRNEQQMTLPNVLPVERPASQEVPVRANTVTLTATLTRSSSTLLGGLRHNQVQQKASVVFSASHGEMVGMIPPLSAVQTIDRSPVMHGGI